ncbi:amidase [Chengkuizengella axinellae]|uniref:Amidase n=1 Tax=Chengkuizengella axinellae TaxID=3064388 RepID=A0ABT9J0C4_9BACL|nr:amidase [Chengkuizengella sp. 2205SS18-9]MDP5275015.1 amidase [Chengkuizengella sp. 2205SS18-9]
MKQDDFLFYSAGKIAKLIHTGELTSERVTRWLIQRIKQYDPRINSVVNKTLDQLLKEAISADEQIKKGDVCGPLHGVPITFKESYAVKGMKTTSGFSPLKDYMTDFDADIVNRLKEAGAIIVGKTNVPPLLMDLQTDNEIYGRTNNPWDLERTSGGSSGGGAAAVASGFSFLDIGSDIGGSLRVPAHYCGVYSLKPTEHTVSGSGHLPVPNQPKQPDFIHSTHLACYGPLARDIEDLMLAYSIITDSNKLEDRNKPPLNIKKLKIAWMDQLPEVPITKEMKDHVHRFIENLKSHGVQTQKIEQFPVDTNKVWETWGKIIDAELNSNQPLLMRWIEHIVTRSIQKKYPTSSKLVPLNSKNYMNILKQRENLISSFDAFMESYDLFISPVSATSAFPHIKKDKLIGHHPIYKKPIFVDNQPLNYWQATTAYTNLFNVLANPVLTAPIGLNKEKIPIGIQCVGKRGEDYQLLNVMNQIVKEMDMKVPRISF